MRYSTILLDYFYHPRNVGCFPSQDIHVYTGKAGDYSRGDVIQLQLKYSEQKIIETRFKAYGSVATIAIASYISEWLIGKTLFQAQSLTREAVMEIMQLPKVKLYCAVLGEEALKSVLTLIKNENGSCY